TEVRVCYDDEFLYVLAIMHNLGPRGYITPSLKRDFRGQAFDGFTVVLDTYKDKTNAFVFGVNPYGVQREGLISNGGNEVRRGGGGGGGGLSLTWDNKWFSEAKIYQNHWIAEMAIPFKTLRYRENSDSWFVNFYRVDSEYSERSTWSPIPRNFRLVNLAFNKEMKWDRPLSSPGKNISLIPYTAFKTSKDFEEKTSTKSNLTMGGDAKIALSPSLNLDLTINPDFSQVEADQQVTNLDRFEIFFPERRQFFLENADLFASFGSSGARPFFSRRIGITTDTTTGTNIQNQLYFGARMSGNINNRWRVGLMTVQASKEEDISLPSINYTVATLQHRLGQRSNISAIFVNKQAFQDSVGGDFEVKPETYNRTLGVDLNLATPDNKWSGKGYYHRSYDDQGLDSVFSMGFGANYQTYRWEARSDFRSIGANFNPDVGFVRRTDFHQLRGTFYYNFYPSKGGIQSHAPGFDFDVIRNKDVGNTDWDINFLYRINFKNNSRFSMRLRRQYTYLLDRFDPSGSDGQELPANTDYAYNFVFARFNSDQRKPFFFELSTRSGEYFNGTRLNLEGTLSYRYSIKAVLALNFTLNRIQLPQPYNDADLFLIGPRFDITFTRNIFWTTFIQYNSQINNVNINTRFQWRYKPVSDLFIVYTDNYLAGDDGKFIDFNQPKSRALVVKLTYWLNL
ncbi:MAG: carbohydrate binding family 9 domain-containing protein, partial [Cyclobacteriaceae bacterium]|nr:carbohydrate binding family 9 domain-containing protein [Cyclobacteriaceae bacterium]